VFTDINELLKSSVTSKIVPLEPSTFNTEAPAVESEIFRVDVGEVVPIPTLPSEITVNLSEPSVTIESLDELVKPLYPQ
jgi:hypothetical protein